MRMSGSISHWETPALAAHKNDTSGNAGVFLPSPISNIKLLLEPEEAAILPFLRGRCDKGVGGAIVEQARWQLKVPLTEKPEAVQERSRLQGLKVGEHNGLRTTCTV